MLTLISRHRRFKRYRFVCSGVLKTMAKKLKLEYKFRRIRSNARRRGRTRRLFRVLFEGATSAWRFSSNGLITAGIVLMMTVQSLITPSEHCSAIIRLFARAGMPYSGEICSGPLGVGISVRAIAAAFLRILVSNAIRATPRLILTSGDCNLSRSQQ